MNNSWELDNNRGFCNLTNDELTAVNGGDGGLSVLAIIGIVGVCVAAVTGFAVGVYNGYKDNVKK